MTWHITQIHAKRALAIQEEVHRTGCHVYMPMMRSKRYVDGQESNLPRPAFPGYMFVWGANGNFYARDGRTIIARILGSVADGEVERVRADNTIGRHDEIAAGESIAERGASRKPRRSKRARKRLRAARNAARALMELSAAWQGSD